MPLASYPIGLAFQIIDDVLDLTASPDQIGKTTGLDLAQGKGYAAAYGDGHNDNGVAVAEATNGSADPMETIKRKLLKGDAMGKPRCRRRLAANAIAQLDACPTPPPKTNSSRSLRRSSNTSREFLVKAEQPKFRSFC